MPDPMEPPPTNQQNSAPVPKQVRAVETQPTPGNAFIRTTTFIRQKLWWLSLIPITGLVLSMALLPWVISLNSHQGKIDILQVELGRRLQKFNEAKNYYPTHLSELYPDHVETASYFRLHLNDLPHDLGDHPDLVDNFSIFTLIRLKDDHALLCDRGKRWPLSRKIRYIELRPDLFPFIKRVSPEEFHQLLRNYLGPPPPDPPLFPHLER